MAERYTLISTAPSGGAANAASYGASYSPDGTKVVFVSAASSLAAGDTNGVSDVFVRDLATGVTTRVSTSVAGFQANAASTGLPRFLPGGTKVVFESAASNLVAGDANGAGDVFLKDLTTGAVVRISTNAAGAEGNGANAGNFSRLGVSSDGARILFQSAASNLVPGDTNGATDVFVKTLATGAIARVSTDAAGLEGNGFSFEAVFSPDGTKVAFASGATNLVATGDTNQSLEDVFVKTLATGAIIRISADGAGVQANGSSSRPVFSPDGTKVAFESTATNLAPGDADSDSDVFLKDLTTGAVTLISTFATGVKPVFSPTGRLVTYTRSDLGAVFAKDLETGEVSLVLGGSAISTVDSSSFSPDGSSILLSTRSALVAADTGTFEDIYAVKIGGVWTGSAGPDTLTGGAGDDQLFGQGGDDVLQPFAGRNTIDGGAGVDTLDYYNGSPSFLREVNVYVDLRSGFGYVNGVQTESIANVENLVGGFRDDVLAGDDGPNLINGVGGADQLYGFGGDDTVRGATSDFGFQNQIFGGSGSDTVNYSALTSNLYVNLAAGSGAVGGTLKDLLNSVENVIGGSLNDTLVGTEADGNLLNGGGATDMLFGLGGDDVLVGGGIASGSYNQLFGGPGLDTASYAGLAFPVYASIEGTGGFVNPGSGFVLFDSYSSIENLVGGPAPDVLIGDAGANRITGGGGADQLYGRAGADTFVFLAPADSSPAGGTDTVADFQTGIDKVDLSALGFTAGQVVVASAGGSTVLGADLDPTLVGYEFAISFIGANALALGDIVF